MRSRFTFLEGVWLILGCGIVVVEIGYTQSLSFEEVGLAVFFFGLLAASVADRTGSRGPIEFIRELMKAFRGPTLLL